MAKNCLASCIASYNRIPLIADHKSSKSPLSFVAKSAHTPALVPDKCTDKDSPASPFVDPNFISLPAFLNLLHRCKQTLSTSCASMIERLEAVKRLLIKINHLY